MRTDTQLIHDILNAAISGGAAGVLFFGDGWGAAAIGFLNVAVVLMRDC